MTDPVETDATKALADLKAVGASLVTEEAKVKTLWAKVKTFIIDYRLPIACTLCLIIGAFVGHKL